MFTHLLYKQVVSVYHLVRIHLSAPLTVLVLVILDIFLAICLHCQSAFVLESIVVVLYEIDTSELRSQTLFSHVSGKYLCLLPSLHTSYFQLHYTTSSLSLKTKTNNGRISSLIQPLKAARGKSFLTYKVSAIRFYMKLLNSNCGIQKTIME